jgi:5-methylcytosine-specific restriction endonuclease McrA
LQIAEFDPDKVFAMVTREPGKDNWQDFTLARITYRVNLGSDRYFVLKNSRVCACCGLRGTHMSLDKNAQQTKETGVECYHFNLYAVNTDERMNKHYALMVKDHIIARSNGGTEDFSNFQTLCYYCNCLKDATDMTVEQMRKAIFPAYRVYKSTMVLNKTKEALEPYRRLVLKNFNTARNIQTALEKVNDERVEAMKDKMAKAWQEAEWLQKQCDRLEIEAQVSGFVPDLKFLDQR